MSSEMSIDGDRRCRVVAAALNAFSRFGYRRTAMADIAAAAGLSRPSLYLVFPNKPAVFRALAESLLADAMVAAEAAWPEGMAPAEGLAAAILAKDLGIHRLFAATPHAAEILAEAETLAGDLHRETATRFAALVAARLAAAGDGEAEATARLVANAADGLKHAGLDEATYVADVRRLAWLVAGRLDKSDY
jgi:AcrR family transcriptional regulator